MFRANDWELGQLTTPRECSPGKHIGKHEGLGCTKSEEHTASVAVRAPHTTGKGGGGARHDLTRRFHPSISQAAVALTKEPHGLDRDPCCHAAVKGAARRKGFHPYPSPYPSISYPAGDVSWGFLRRRADDKGPLKGHLELSGTSTWQLSSAGRPVHAPHCDPRILSFPRHS